MKTEAAKKTISTIFTFSETDLCLYSVFPNHQLNSKKHLNSLKNESETTWTRPNCSTPADLIQLPQANITSTITNNYPMTRSDTIREEW